MSNGGLQLTVAAAARGSEAEAARRVRAMAKQCMMMDLIEEIGNKRESGDAKS